MADYAGAVAAIKARLAAGWTTTTIVNLNEGKPTPWPPVTVANALAPFVLLEVIATRAYTLPGDPGSLRHKVQEGFISTHVMVPVGSGTADAFTHAVALGALFENKQFFDTDPGVCIRTWTPAVDGGGEGSEDGIWFRVSMTVAFEFRFRA